MAQLLETKAASLRVQGDVHRRNKDKTGWESFNKTFTSSDKDKEVGLKTLTQRLLFTTYDFDNPTVLVNKERVPAPQRDANGNVTKWTFFTLRYNEKKWNGNNYVLTKNSNGKVKTFSKDAVIPDRYTACTVTEPRLTGNNLHFSFTAKRGMPKLYGDGNMYGGIRYKKGITFNSEGYVSSIGNTDRQTWEQYAYVKKGGEWVWNGLTGKTWNRLKTATKPEVKYWDKNGKQLSGDGASAVKKTGYRRKRYWSPFKIEYKLKNKKNNTYSWQINCKSYNHVGQIVSYPGFQGNITNERIATVVINDKDDRIKALYSVGFSNTGADGSGAASCYVTNFKFKCPKCKKEATSREALLKEGGCTCGTSRDTRLPNGKYIYIDLMLGALDNRTFPTYGISGNVNIPVTLNVDAYLKKS